MLSDNQIIGLKYYEDFKDEIPRAEITNIYNRIIKTAKELFKEDFEHMIFEVSGSYRRGKEFSNEIDLLATRTDNSSIKGLC